MEPLVSIIMPCYNSAKFIGKSIDSVLCQSYTNWELLITDDCSLDDSIAVIEKYCHQDHRIKLFRLLKNSGSAVARNYSLSHSIGRFIAFLDSDDLWDSNKLEVQVSYMLKNDYGFTYSNYRVIDESEKLLKEKLPMPVSLTYTEYLRNTAIGCLTVIIDKEKVGAFQMPIIRTSQDMATWLKVLKYVNKAYCLNQVLASYRVYKSSSSANKLKAAKDVWRVYRNLEHLSLMRSVYSFLGYVFFAIKKRL